MKTLNVENTGLTELSTFEQKNVAGGFGFLPWIAAGAAYVGKNVVDNWQFFKDGLMGRKHSPDHCGK